MTTSAPQIAAIRSAIVDALKPAWQIGLHQEHNSVACWHESETPPAGYLVVWPNCDPTTRKPTIEIEMRPGLPGTDGIRENPADLLAITSDFGAWRGTAVLVDVDPDAPNPWVNFLPKLRD